MASFAGAAVADREERERQKKYWIEHSADLTADSDSSETDSEEMAEVLSLLPPYEGKTVAELGAGVGRFTAELAQKAAQVLAVDFIEDAIKKNESINGHRENVKFICADVTSPELDISENSVDLIFSNQLLMYLSDEEVKTLAERMIKWLKVGGYIFFREPCFQHCEKSDKRHDLSHYIGNQDFIQRNVFELSLLGCKPTGAHLRDKESQNQICWIWQKVHSDNDRGFQQFLDTVQYKSSGILRYERVFGHGFVSPGGLETTKEFVAKLDLKSGQRVLDVGCGIGGACFYMAENFNVEVVGIDLSINMISLALERVIGLKCSVEFEVADCTKKTYPDQTFDVIYSRDTILHIQDKPALFRSFYKWLKPEGKLFVTDYCRSTGTSSPEFAEYIKQRGYDLHDVKSYGQMIGDAGFSKVVSEDRTNQFIRVLQQELKAVEEQKDTFIHDFSEDGYNDIICGWKAKLNRSLSGEQRWGLIFAKKTN